MAQMPIHLVTGRAEAFTAPPTRPAVAPGTSRPAAPPAGRYLLDSGGISGGELRPGTIDQARFKALLAATYGQNGKTPATVAAPAPTPATTPRAPSLSPAQLAALGAVDGPIAPESATPQIAATDATASATAPEPDANPQTATTAPASSAAAEPRVAGPMPRARRGADGVWELPRLPDKDEREMLRGQTWRLVEDPESTKLFLGEDGKFGWDDFVDLINPLQHIPLVNVAYRAITGDEIDGAARLIDFAFGPMAGVSTAVDLAFRSTTGDSMADHAIAAVFGGGDAASANVASSDEAMVTTASGMQRSEDSMIRRGSHR